MCNRNSENSLMIQCKNAELLPLAAELFYGDFPKDKIQVLKISDSKIQEIPAAYFEKLKSLTELTIINSRTKVLYNDSFKGLFINIIIF